MAALWRKRFLTMGIKGLLKDTPRPGRTPSIPASTVEQVISKNHADGPGQCDALVDTGHGA
jgi:hypothetical protein